MGLGERAARGTPPLWPPGLTLSDPGGPGWGAEGSGLTSADMRAGWPARTCCRAHADLGLELPIPAQALPFHRREKAVSRWEVALRPRKGNSFLFNLSWAGQGLVRDC